MEPTRTIAPPEDTRLRRAERAENFPVAMTLLPRRLRERIRAVYDVVRTIDDIGDEGKASPAVRTAALEAFRRDLAAACDPDGGPALGVLRRLQPIARALDLSPEPFDRLIEANLADQRVARYPDREALMAYCALSAVPIGRLVLAVFEVEPTSAVTARADRVCTALQLLEHWQDVGEDRGRGRIYLPADAMAAAAVAETDLDGPTASPALRRLVLDETARAEALLRAGEAVVRDLRGWARLAVAGYVAGGYAAADALRRSGGETVASSPRVRRRDVVRHGIAVLQTNLTRTPVAAAYDACESITRHEARNFAYGIRLLPRSKRRALSAVYALARRIDDIGDGDSSTEAKVSALAAVRAAVQASVAAPPDPADPVLVAVTDAARRLPIPLAAFDELVDGVERDVRMDAGTLAGYATFDELVGYCRCVAGSVGRLCLGVFGSRPHPDAAHYADALGIALQQTNILRDIREDLLGGRVYLPKEDLDRFGVTLRLDADGALADPDGALAALIQAAAERARGWYAEGLRLVPLLDRRSAACATAMAGIYRRLLEDIAADPTSVYDRRKALSGRQKLGVAARALAGRG